MLFEPMILVAGGATLLIAGIDKTLSEFGFHGLGTIIRFALPILAFAAGIYFIETNALIGWLFR
jgi:hypothetical protein